MGGILAALSAIRNWGRNVPHLHSHFDCDCSNDQSSSSSEENDREVRKSTTWLQRHRPDSKKPGVVPHHPAKGKEQKRTHSK